jgi:hypothetical protein
MQIQACTNKDPWFYVWTLSPGSLKKQNNFDCNREYVKNHFFLRTNYEKKSVVNSTNHHCDAG